MRLIDADILIKQLEWLDEDDYILFEEVKKTVDKTPTVKAIPIEWIKENYAYYGFLKELIEHWEKENVKVSD